MHLSWLFERMTTDRESIAVVWRDQRVTYGDLLDRVATWERDLDAASIGAGQVVSIDGDYSPSTCALMLALIHRGAIVVPITEASAAHRDEFLEIAEVQASIAVDGHDAWSLDVLRAEAPHPLFEELRRRNSPGLVIFSSGSTGHSKAAVHDVARLLEKFTVIRQKLVTITFLLFDHIGGINTLLYTLSNGGTVVTAQSRDPETVAELVEQHRIQLLPASPTFLSLLLMSGGHRRFDLSSLQLVTYGTEVMPQATLDRLHKELPNVRFQQTYGLSELGILRSKSRGDGSLWVKVGGEGVETKVVDDLLLIRTRSAMLGYLNAPSPFDDEGWMNTQDRVEVDGEWLKILGRVSDIINVGGNKVYPAEVESVMLELDNVLDATVYGEPNAITGAAVAVRVVLAEPEAPDALMKRVRQHCRERLARFKIPVRIAVVERADVSARYKRVRR